MKLDISSPFFLYMAEAEGMTNIVNTETAKKNAEKKEKAKEERDNERRYYPFY